MIFTIFITGFSLNVLLQMIFKFESTFKVIYVSNWVFSPLMNTILWGIITLLNVVILFSVFNLASRSEKARKLFVMLLPIVCALSILRSIGDIMSRSTPETPVGLVIVLVIAVLSLTYLPIFFFYRNANVKKTIFSNGKADEKIETA